MADIIRLATSSDFEFVWNLISECSKWLADRGFTHWKDYYTQDIVKQKMNEGVYCMIHNNEIVGTVSVQTKAPAYYSQKDMKYFKNPTAKAAYITMLAVKPNLHGKGIALKLMWFAEKLASDMGISFLRLDINGKHRQLGRFYERRGYTLVGSYLENDYDTSLYEKEL